MSDNEQLSLGAVLRRRREELQLSVQAVADKTRIRPPFIQAFEEDRFDVFPGEAYLCGFLKNVAETLDLDAREMLAQFRRQTGTLVGGETADSAVSTLPLRHKGVGGRRWLGLLLVAGLAALVGAYWWDAQPAPRGSVMDAPPQMSPISGEFSIATLGVPVVSESVAEPPPVEVAAEPRTPPAELSVSYVLPATGGVLRAEAQGAVELEVRIDELPSKRYVLAKAAMLSWQVWHSAEVQFGGPATLQFWLDDQPLDLQGQSRLLLVAPPVAGDR